MRKSFLIAIVIIFIGVIFLIPVNSYALGDSISDSTVVLTNSNNINSWMNDYNSDQGSCASILGNPSDPNSVAWLVVTVLNYFRVLGPLAVIVLSGIDYVKAIINSDDDAMKKTSNRLGKRLILAALLFLIPSIVKLLLQVFNIVSDPLCGIGS